MTGRQNRTLICSVLFVDIVGYSREPVAAQIRLRNHLNALLSAALKGVALDERVILDTGDGAAISFLGDPDDALFMALTLRDAAAAPAAAVLRMRYGINLGPVKLVKDLNGRPNVVGDGINVAQRIMSFSVPGQVLVSRSYFEVVSRLSEEYAKLFRHAGSRTDKHVREHEVYAVEAGVPALRRMAVGHDARRSARSGPGARIADRLGRAANGAAISLHRRPALATSLAVAMILTLAVGLRTSRGNPPAPPADALVSTEVAAPQPTQLAARASDSEPVPPAVEPVPSLAPAAGAQPAKPVVLIFAVAPWGEIHVDGRKRGVSPPLRKLTVAPGSHRIEVRNTVFPSHVESIHVAAGSQTTIRHRFTESR